MSKEILGESILSESLQSLDIKFRVDEEYENEYENCKLCESDDINATGFSRKKAKIPFQILEVDEGLDFLIHLLHFTIPKDTKKR